MSSFKKIAKKHLSQNFLINEHIIDKIIASVQISDNETILEIGPGLGALTKRLVETKAQIFAIEKDPAIIPKLNQTISSQNFHLIKADFLAYDLSQIPRITKIIGNIPYNISTPILKKLIDNQSRFAQAFLTTQLEFAKRLTAVPGTKEYGALTCFLQYYGKAKILFPISGRCFRPVPKVTSCFLNICFEKPKLQASNEELLFRITQAAFQQRRKKIQNALSGLVYKEKIEEILEQLNLKKGARPDQISPEDYVRISNRLSPSDLISFPASQKTSA